MNFYMKHYGTNTQFQNDKANLVRPAVAMVGSQADHVMHYLGIEAAIGDILYSDKSFSASYDSSKTPIAICVAPASHFVDGKARWMSLVNMSLTDPENGTKATGNDENNPGAGIRWGYNEAAVGDTDDTLATLICSAVNEPTNELSEDTVSWGYLPSDYFTSETIEIPVEYPLNSALHYYGDDGDMDGSEGGALVSPFNSDGSVNPSSRLHALAAENGYSLTTAIIAAATATETTGAIENSYAEGHYPAAMACHRFRTVGTAAGDWYLPAACELQYLIPNLVSINAKLTALSTNAICVGDYSTADTLGSYLWSSSEYGSNSAWYLRTGNGGLDRSGKNYINSTYRVRAFLAL